LQKFFLQKSTTLEKIIEKEVIQSKKALIITIYSLMIAQKLV